MAELIKSGLEEQAFPTKFTYDDLSGKKLSSQDHFDLIITEIILPKMDRIDLCKHIQQTMPDIPIIMLTALGTTDDKVAGFDADNYMVKPFEIRELLVRIRALMKRNHKSSGGTGFMLRFDGLEMNLHTKIVKRDYQEISLTPKEFKLLE